MGDRHLTARSIAKAALALTDYRRFPTSLAFAEGGVGERVKSLLAPRRSSNWRTTLVLVVLLAIAAVALVVAERSLDSVFDLAH